MMEIVTHVIVGLLCIIGVPVLTTVVVLGACTFLEEQEDV